METNNMLLARGISANTLQRIRKDREDFAKKHYSGGTVVYYKPLTPIQKTIGCSLFVLTMVIFFLWPVFAHYLFSKK